MAAVLTSREERSGLHVAHRWQRQGEQRRPRALRFRPDRRGRACPHRPAQRWRILAVSITVSTVTVAVEMAADHLLDRADLTAAVAGSVSTSGVSLLGAVFLSGFLSRLVSHEHGTDWAGPARAGSGSRIRDVLRSLPWGPLIRADLLVAADHRDRACSP